jgi:hypothetical protein
MFYLENFDLKHVASQGHSCNDRNDKDKSQIIRALKDSTGSSFYGF